MRRWISPMIFMGICAKYATLFDNVGSQNFCTKEVTVSANASEVSRRKSCSSSCTSSSSSSRPLTASSRVILGILHIVNRGTMEFSTSTRIGFGLPQADHWLPRPPRYQLSGGRASMLPEENCNAQLQTTSDTR